MKIIAFGDTVISDEIFNYKINDLLIKDLQADLVTFNLETVVSNDDELNRSNKAICFKIENYNLRWFINLVGCKTLCNIANNHIFDYGYQGFIETTQTLKNYDIPYVGTYQEVVYMKVDGVKIGIIGAYDNFESHHKKYLNYFDQELFAKIHEIKQKADVCILHLHWGKELCLTVSPKQTQMAHYLIDAGCDVILGHHPHVMQGIEKYKNGLIFYSLGNFLIPINPFERLTRYSCMVNLDIGVLGDSIKIEYELIPIVLSKEGIPTLCKKNDIIVWNRIIKEIDAEMKNISKSRYYINMSKNYLKESNRAWKQRMQNHEVGVMLKYFRWIFSGIFAKSLIFAFIDLLTGYTKRRQGRIWRDNNDC